MPLYEIVLCFHDRIEVRLTDCDPRADGHVRIGSRRLPVAADAIPDDPGITRRYYVRMGDAPHPPMSDRLNA